LAAKDPYKKGKEARFGPLINLGPMMLVGALGTLETLGTHFKIPLGTENLLTLQNLIMWPLFMQ